MSKRISLSKLTKKVEEKKVATSSSKGVVIHKKQPQDEAPDSSPNKKGKTDDSKGKKTMPPPKVKKAKSSRTTSRGTMRPVAPGDGTSASPGDALGFGASLMASAFMEKKFLVGVILPADKENVDKLSARYLFTFIFSF